MTVIGVVTFPGSLDDRDAVRAVRRCGSTAVRLWHNDPSLQNVDAVILPGGFSYGDYLRCGAIARFAPVMESITDAARQGMPVLGICNGFQILCEAHLLPGALVRNQHMHFRNRDQRLRVGFGEKEDLATLQAVVGGLGSGERLMVDINQGWDLATARHMVGRLAEFPLRQMPSDAAADYAAADHRDPSHHRQPLRPSACAVCRRCCRNCSR